MNTSHLKATGSPTAEKVTPALEARRENLIDAYWAGELGDNEFADLGINLGMEAHEISQVMSDVREEDGTP